MIKTRDFYSFTGVPYRRLIDRRKEKYMYNNDNSFYGQYSWTSQVPCSLKTYQFALSQQLVWLKPNSITLASSELAPNMFEAGSCQIPLQ